MYHIPRKKKPLVATIRQCHRCRGAGRAPCQFCRGSGYVVKKRDVHGRPVHDRCSACFGNKVTKCTSCSGIGFS